MSQIVLRTAGEVSQLATAMRAQVRAVDSRIGLTPPQSAAEGVDQGLYAQPRFSMMVVVIFAVTGLGLAALGIYGVISYTVSQQTREIAIRMALGGERRHVRLQVLGFTLRLMGAGIVLGLLGGFLVARLIATQLWNVAPHDPLTFATAGAVILGVGVMACAVPARRATRVTPAAALRHD